MCPLGVVNVALSNDALSIMSVFLLLFTECVGVARKQTLDKCRDTESATTRTEGTCAWGTDC